MLDARLKELLEALYQQTKQGNISWQETSSSNTFAVVLKGYAVTIESSMSLTGTLTLRDEQGREIERSSVTFNNSEWQRFEELYKVARRQARRIDEAVDEVLKQLKIA